MRRNPEFLLRNVAGSDVVVPVGKATLEFSGMITLNETGALLWELLETEQTVASLTAGITDQYEVTATQAEADVQIFLNKLRPTGALIED